MSRILKNSTTKKIWKILEIPKTIQKMVYKTNHETSENLDEWQKNLEIWATQFNGNSVFHGTIGLRQQHIA